MNEGETLEANDELRRRKTTTAAEEVEWLRLSEEEENGGGNFRWRTGALGREGQQMRSRGGGLRAAVAFVRKTTEDRRDGGTTEVNEEGECSVTKV